MNIYLLHQHKHNGYDTFSGLVVVARSEAEARRIHPWGSWKDEGIRVWVETPEEVEVTLLGLAEPNLRNGEKILKSYHAG